MKLRGGLKQSKKDRRDIKYGSVFSLPKLEDLPKDGIGILHPIEIKDQGSDDTCAARSSDAVSEDQELLALCDYFTFALAKSLDGDPAGWGTDLRTVAKVHTTYGALAKKDCELCKNNNHDLNRDRDLNNWKNVDDLKELAKLHKKSSYFSTEGPYDTFDNIRAILWAEKIERRSVFTGISWHPIWISSANGFIPKFDLDKETLGHAFKIFDWKDVAGEPYLIAQLSSGTEVGDKGLFYFPRNVINAGLTFGGYTFSDMPIEVAKQQGWSLGIKILDYIKTYYNYIKSYFEKEPTLTLFFNEIFTRNK